MQLLATRSWAAAAARRLRQPSRSHCPAHDGAAAAAEEGQLLDERGGALRCRTARAAPRVLSCMLGWPCRSWASLMYRVPAARCHPLRRMTSCAPW